MVKCHYLLAILRKLVDAHGAKIVDLQRLFDRVIEVDAGSRVKNDLQLFAELPSHCRIYAKLLLHKITLYSDDSLAHNSLELRPLLEQDSENLRTEDLLLESFLSTCVLSCSDQNVHLAEPWH